MTGSSRRLRHRIESMRRLVRGMIHLNEPMDKHTTWGVGGPADALFFPKDREDLLCGLELCRREEVPVVIMGNGSNLLVRDGGIRGMVVCTDKLAEVRVAAEDANGAQVAAESGLLLSRLLNFCISRGLSGLEFATGIPGTIGGAVMMNAGAYGGAIADVLSWVEMIDREGRIGRIEAASLGFGYRSCRLPVEGGVIVEAGFALVRRPEREVLERVKEILAQRQKRLPFGWRNAGSVFKNPPGDHAGRIVEALGFKGRTVGRAMVSDQHANVIINTGGAAARDIIALMDEIAREAREKLGVVLESEVIIVGEG